MIVRRFSAYEYSSLEAVLERCKYGFQDSFCRIFQCLRRCSSLNLRIVPSQTIFTLGKYRIGRDQGISLVVKEPAFDVLTCNFTPGETCEQAPYRDGSSTT
ncbi:hypothetical protein AVEN_108584-1 [Araneus ventricosus]|uniref:Uncharacterized protein n=1 Tax=Araneus ventricosus TaxID=182803 RepID=A0A4Y2DIY2_ARAVE|nr:hypothetical protein AVEN_108584-1 [Araneus ventricosus]